MIKMSHIQTRYRWTVINIHTKYAFTVLIFLPARSKCEFEVMPSSDRERHDDFKIQLANRVVYGQISRDTPGDCWRHTVSAALF